MWYLLLVHVSRATPFKSLSNANRRLIVYEVFENLRKEFSHSSNTMLKCLAVNTVGWRQRFSSNRRVVLWVPVGESQVRASEREKKRGATQLN